MADQTNENVSRREFLKLGVTVTAGAIVPPMLAACGGGDSYVLPKETFVEPLNIQSVNGVLDVTLVLSYLTTTLPDATGKKQTVTLRNMYGTIPAPTLRMRVGDLLRIKVFNNLPANPAYPPVNPVPPATLPWPQPAHLRYPNSTNLHTHGLHVYPDIYPQPYTPPGQNPDTSNPPKLYGDFVVDDPEQGIKPGETRQYEYRIREDHPAGTYWYHPHLHGSSAMQVGSGMAGALIIEGPIDDVPEIAAAQERVFVFQAPLYDSTGKLESFGFVASVTNNEPPFMINGVRQPTIVMKSGEVQNWRFVNAGTFNMLNLSLDTHTLYQYSHDGNPRRTFRLNPPLPPSAFTPATDPPPKSYPEGVVLAVGNRTNVLVKAGAPGTYQLRNFPIENGRNPAGVLPGDVVATVIVLNDPYPMSLPPEPLPVTPFLAPITDEELAANGGLKRTIVMRVIASTPGSPTIPVPFEGAAKTPLVHPGDEITDWVFQQYFPDPPTETPPKLSQIANKVYALGSDGTASSQNPGMPRTYIPFQSKKAVTQMVALNAVEEWTIVNMNNIRHPFHIHVNPMYIVAVNGKRLAEPFWADTMPLPFNDNPPPVGEVAPDTVTSFTFRMRFIHFTGRYVMHCHMLVHEDMGMMQGVTVV
jgi:FtsP/CotA-like multicopper oxidase with cupredoxin domain